jgi:hypothetical protein
MGDAITKIIGVFILVVWLAYWAIGNLVELLGG